LPLFNRKQGFDALQLALIPLGVGRVKKAVLEYILSGKLDLEDDFWEVAVIERDIPSAHLAFEELKQEFNHLFALEGQGNFFPSVELSLYHTEEFSEVSFISNYKGTKGLIKDFDKEKQFDLLLDFSVLSRKSEKDLFVQTKAKYKAIIRSSYSPNTLRTFSHSPAIPFTDISGLASDNQQRKEYIDALNFFSKNIFRFEKLRDNQIETISAILTRTSTLAISPPASGKTLSWQLAAMLSPGITAIITPDNRLMNEQFDNLRKVATDATSYINADNRKAAIKKRVINDFQGNRTLITFISPEKLINEYFKDLTSNMLVNGSLFSLVIFDEAQSISQNSLHFNPHFQEVASKIKPFFSLPDTEQATVLALTSFAGRTVKHDIWNLLSIEQKNTLNLKWERPNLEYNIVNSNSETSEKENTEKDLVASNELKQIATVELVEKTLTDSTKKIVLVLPKEKGIYGAGIQGIAKKFNEKRFEYSVLNSGLKIKEYQKFNDGDTNLLLTNASTFSFGFDVKGVTDLIMFNMPSSPEQLFRLAGKLGRDGNSAKIHILRDNNKLRFVEFSDLEMMTGDSEVMELAGHYPPAEIITRKMQRQTFPGRRRELTILDELLHNIDFQVETPGAVIQARILEEFNIDVELVLQPQQNPYMISVVKNSRTLGHVNYKTNEINIANDGFDKNLSGNILSFIQFETEKLFPQTHRLFSEIFAEKKHSPNTGIETVLQNADFNKEYTIEIHPENNAKNEMTANLQEFASEKFTSEFVTETFNNNYYHLSFILALNKVKRIGYVDKNIDLPVRTEQLFYSYRNRTHTFTALNYLKAVGVADEFYTNASDTKIIIKVSKKTDKEYIGNLVKYMSRYISASKAEKAIEAIPEYTGKTTLQKCLNYLVNFSYEYLAETHFNMSDEAGKLFKSISESSPDTVAKKIKDFYSNRADAKYLNPLFTPSLVLDTDGLQKSNFDIVIKTIRNTGQYIAKREHLQESTETLLKIAPKNYTLLLLNAYTKFWENEDFETAYVRFAEGFDSMQAQEKLSAIEIDERKEVFLTRLFARSEAVKNEIAPYIKLKSHIAWLQDFNASFLKGMPVTS